ncbi:MAG TPA: hypothetical protein VLH83_10520, partial [Chthoniobacterales bacterium]|nr:hypothetical protein [Chthoniobacterales bacterium]
HWSDNRDYRCERLLPSTNADNDSVFVAKRNRLDRSKHSASTWSFTYSNGKPNRLTVAILDT